LFKHANIEDISSFFFFAKPIKFIIPSFYLLAFFSSGLVSLTLYIRLRVIGEQLLEEVNLVAKLSIFYIGHHTCKDIIVVNDLTYPMEVIGFHCLLVVNICQRANPSSSGSERNINCY